MAHLYSPVEVGRRRRRIAANASPTGVADSFFDFKFPILAGLKAHLIEPHVKTRTL